MNIAEKIRALTPQFHPTQEDLVWFESELDRAQEKILPRLVRRRFTDVLKNAGKVRFQTGANQPPKASPMSPAKA
jgi:hypothetical protein